MNIKIVCIIICFPCIICCQTNKTVLATSISETNYEIKEDSFSLIKYTVEKTSIDDYAVWISEDPEKSGLMKYFLRNQGDFNLLNLTTERILNSNNHIVYSTFVKILDSNERFDIAIIINNPSEQKINKAKKFLEGSIKHESIKELDELIKLENFKQLFFQESLLVLPYEIISDPH